MKPKRDLTRGQYLCANREGCKAWGSEAAPGKECAMVSRRSVSEARERKEGIGRKTRDRGVFAGSDNAGSGRPGGMGVQRRKFEDRIRCGAMPVFIERVSGSARSAAAERPGAAGNKSGIVQIQAIAKRSICRPRGSARSREVELKNAACPPSEIRPRMMSAAVVKNS